MWYAVAAVALLSAEDAYTLPFVVEHLLQLAVLEAEDKTGALSQHEQEHSVVAAEAVDATAAVVG